MDIPETAQNAPSHADSEGVDQFLPEQSLRDGVEDQRPLPGEPDEPPLGVEFEEFPEIQFFNAQSPTLPF